MERLDRAVRAAIEKNVTNFEALCRTGDGAFPTLVRESLRRVAAPVLPADGLDQVAACAWPPDLLPEPHPVDYDWRFTRETAERLAAHVACSGTRIACLGVPTVFLALQKFPVSAHLFDQNPFIAQALHSKHVTVIDLNCERIDSHTGFDVVVMDPPWYHEHTRAWLRQAGALLRPGGRVITTVIPPLTRPSAAADRSDTISQLQEFGTPQPSPFRATYATPLFEQETLRALGFGTLSQWRTCEIFEVELRELPPLNPVPYLTEARWDRFLFNGQVVILRRRSDPRMIRVSPAQDGGHLLLPSVSRRDPCREYIGLWTSRNRCLAIEGYDRLRSFLVLLEMGEPPANLLQRSSSEQERRSLAEVITLIGQ